MRGLELRQGTMLADQYTVDKVIGRGASAKVYKAVDIRTGRDVAAKVFDPTVEGFNAVVVKEEFQTQARLQPHENIIPLYDYSLDTEHPFIIMMHARQGSLEDTLRNGRLPVEKVVKYALETAAGLQRAHALGVTHRDVKLNNTLVDEDVARVTDFGIAVKGHSPHSDVTRQLAKGTLANMSPEQIDGEATSLSDLYGLGIVAFELATGEKPIQGKTVIQLIDAHRHGRRRTFNDILGEDIPASLAAIQTPILKAFSADPDARQRSVAEFSRELWYAYWEAIVDGQEEPETMENEATRALGLSEEITQSIILSPTRVLPLFESERERIVLRDKVIDQREAELVAREEALAQREQDLEEQESRFFSAAQKREVALAGLTEQYLPEDTQSLQSEQQTLRERLAALNARIYANEAGVAVDPLLQAEKANPMIERAKELLGEDFLGVEAVRNLEAALRRVGTHVEFIFSNGLPDFPYTERDLEIAQRNKEVLVLRPANVVFDDLSRAKVSPDLLERLFTSMPFNVVQVKHEQGFVVDDELEAGWKLVRKYPAVGIHETSALAEYESSLATLGADTLPCRQRTAAESVWDTLLTYYTHNESSISQLEVVRYPVFYKNPNVGKSVKRRPWLKAQIDDCAGFRCPAQGVVSTEGNSVIFHDRGELETGEYYPSR